MTCEPFSRRFAHSEGITHLAFDSNRRLVTCGHDCDVTIFVGLEDDDKSEFSLSSSTLSALVCYTTGTDGSKTDVVAVAMDDFTVQAYTTDGSSEGLLMRFTAPVTCLDVNPGHTHLAAGSAEFTIKVVEICDPSKTYTLHGHEAPLLCVKFDPKGELLASSCCDGSVKIWDLKSKECIQTFPLFPKCNDTNLAKSLCSLAWFPQSGKVLAIPVESEVKVYDRVSWKCLFTLSDDHHKEAVNIVCWSPCGKYLASGAVDGGVVLWSITGNRTAYKKCMNENGIGITSLEWDPRGRGSEIGEQLLFADLEGHIGAFDNVYPDVTMETNDQADSSNSIPIPNDDPLVDDSLLMEGIPADDIFDNFEDDVMDEDLHGDRAEGNMTVEDDDNEIVQSRKRPRFDSDGDDPGTSDLISDELSNQSDPRVATPLDDQLTNEISAPPGYFKKPGPTFSEKLVNKCHAPFQSSSTPEQLQHRFMVYNLVGVVRSHSDEEASMVEVEFHNTSTHHSFSLPNPAGYSMASLSEQALVLASEKQEEQSSQLHCVHFGSWDNNKDWTVSLASKESICSIAVGDGWIAMATNKQMLRLFSVGGVQREVISIPGYPVTLSGWGSRLVIVYQSGPCTENVFSLTIWVLDVKKRKQLHPPHSLPLSHRSKLEWIGFSEEGILFSYDTKGMVRILAGSCYGGLSWIPVLDTTKQLGNKSDHYFIVGMTHNPDELRAILCKGLSYPPVQPKPVMNTLQLHLPLCDANTDKSTLESQYVQTWLLSGRPGVESGPAQVQQLMKLFALACKTDHEFRAYEIAGMMPDEHSMNLALTYASRTQHVRLARHISELIQQKSMEEPSDDENFEDPIGQFDSNWTNENTDGDVADDVTYAKSRSHSLNKKSDLVSKFSGRKINLSNKFGKVSSTTDGSSKFNHYMDQVKRGKFLSSRAGSGQQTSKILSKKSDLPEEDERDFEQEDEESLDKNYNHEGTTSTTSDLRRREGYNETKELFSDSEQDGGNDLADGEAGEEDRGSDNGIDDDFSFTPSRDVGGYSSSSTVKRANPFKMATPVSKRIQQDRKSTFLDNISTRAGEEQLRKKEKKSKEKEKSVEGGKTTKRKLNKMAGAGGGGGAAKKVQQSSLKSTFFKQPAHKATAGGDSNTPSPPPTSNDRGLPSISELNEGEEGEHDTTTVSDNHVADIAESVKQNSKQKLADLAFKPAAEP